MPEEPPRGVELHGNRYRVRTRVDGNWLTRSFDRLDDAVAFRQEIERHRERRRAGVARSIARFAGAKLTLEELCRRWFATKAPKLAPGTARNYEIAIRVHIAPKIGHLDANLVKEADLEEFYRSGRFDPAKKSHQVLRHAFAWGRRNLDELVRLDDPTRYVAPSRRDCIGHDGTFSYDDDDVRPVDHKKIPLAEHVEKLRIDAEQRCRRWWCYIVLAIVTAARPGELCALRRRDIDITAGTVTIAWSADRVSGRIKRPKTRWSIRTLHVGTAALAPTAPFLPDDPGAFLFTPDHRSPMPCWNARGVHRRLAKALKRCGLPPYSPHSFRHYTATRLLAAGISPTQVARFLGHKDETLVRKLYGNHIAPEAQRSIADVLSTLAP